MQSLFSYFDKLSNQDYVILGICLILSLYFIYLWIEKVYRIYLWLVIWLATFFIINLIIDNLNSINHKYYFYNFFKDNKNSIWIWSILLIPFFTLALPFNSLINFRINKNQLINYFISFSFWFLFLIFYLSIFVSISWNKFLFTLNEPLLKDFNNLNMTKSIYSLMEPSLVFSFIKNNDTLINLVIILFLFYKMTIWWIVDFLINILIRITKNIIEGIKENSQNNTKTWK